MKNLKIIDHVQSMYLSSLDYLSKKNTKYENIIFRKVFKYFFYNFLIMFIISPSESSIWIRVIVVFIIFLYTLNTIARAQAIKNIRKKIRSHSLIFLNTNQKDLIQRQQSTRMTLRFIFRCFITIFVILRLAILFNPEIDHRDHFNENAIIFFLVLYFIYYFFCRLSLKISNMFWLIIVLVFTNPVFSLYISLISLNYIGKLRNKSVFATNTEGFLYMLLQIGTETKFIIFSLIYSLICHLTFVFIQPTYKIEKSRMALESITVIYGIVSILGLVYSKEIAKVLFEYLITTPYFGEGFFQAARSSGYHTISSLSGFTSFFEKTFKLFLLPFTICASLATMIFKFREFFSKNMSNNYFQKVALSQDILLNEQIALLKKAIYYGGGTMKNTILGHHLLYKHIPDLLEKSNKKTSLVKYWLRKSSVIYRRYRRKAYNKSLLITDRYQSIKTEINEYKEFIKNLSIAKKIKLFIITVIIFIFFVILILISIRLNTIQLIQ